MLKKLKRCIIDFNQSAYFQSIGLKKLKLEPDVSDKPYDAYYDEEAKSNSHITPGQSSVVGGQQS